MSLNSGERTPANTHAVDPIIRTSFPDGNICQPQKPAPPLFLRAVPILRFRTPLSHGTANANHLQHSEHEIAKSTALRCSTVCVAQLTFQYAHTRIYTGYAHLSVCAHCVSAVFRYDVYVVERLRHFSVRLFRQRCVWDFCAPVRHTRDTTQKSARKIPAQRPLIACNSAAFERLWWQRFISMYVAQYLCWGCV